MCKIVFIILISFVIFGCDSSNNDEFTIVTNPWIGYSPIFYLDKIGKLDEMGIKLIHTVSLSNGNSIFSKQQHDAITGTQYEYFSINKGGEHVVFPIILLDRSFGGDVILGNTTLTEILEYDSVIDVYMEVDSVNKILLDNFSKIYKLDEKQFNLINLDQGKISNIINTFGTPMLIVTYSPYDTNLIANGFNYIMSTRDAEKLLILDAIFVDATKIKKFEKLLVQLKAEIDNAINIAKFEPRMFHDKTKHYLNNISYVNFKNDINKIRWINHNPAYAISRLKNDNINIEHIK